MSTLDTGLTLIRTAAVRFSAVNGWMGNAFKSWMPTGLYARALLIMIVPMVILQTVVAFVFMERHWNTVTRRLSAAVVQDIASLIDVYKGYPQDKDRAQLRQIGQRMQLVVDFLPVGDMPPPGPKPFFSLLDQTLSVQLGRQIRRPFWIDTVGNSNTVEIRIQLDDAVMRIFAQRSAAYASNSEIFIFWMLGTSTILLIVMFGRLLARHFTPERHFGFEAAAWYWHFVDVVWLFLFASIYVWGAGVIEGHG